MQPDVTWSFSIDVDVESMGQMDVWRSPRSRLKHSKTEAPTEERRVNMLVTIVHLFKAGSYRSTEFRLDDPSLPPSAYKKPPASTTSWVDRREFIWFTGSLRNYSKNEISIHSSANCNLTKNYSSSWTFHHCSCTSSRRFRQYNKDSPVQQHRSCFVLKSLKASAT